MPAVITQIFNPIAELVITKGMPTDEVNTEIETETVKAEVHLKTAGEGVSI